MGDGLAVYPGTLVGKGFDDPGVSELVVVSFPGQSPVVERLPFPTRTIQTQTIDLGSHETLDGLLAELERTADPQAIVRLELCGVQPSDYDAGLLRGRLAGSFFHIEVDDQSLMIADAELERLTHQPTIKGIFTRLMRQRISAAGDDLEQQRTARLALLKGLKTFDTSGHRQ